MVERLVIALGGNAFAAAAPADSSAHGGGTAGPRPSLTMATQFAFAARLAERLAPVLAGPRQIVLTHGNGPQVGQMLVRVEETLGKAYALPLEVCVAESEGELGYVLLQSMQNALRAARCPKTVVSLLTQVVVDPADPAFDRPTKPVGVFYTAEQAARLRERGFAVAEDAGRGYRRLVPSPRPRRVVEIDAIERLLSADMLVIAAGGGGIPVIEEQGTLRGVEAVVDKDLSSALLGEQLGAQTLLILTGEPCVYLDYGTARAVPLPRLTPDEAEDLLAAGQFPPGSMGPKIEAAVRFARRPGCQAIICDPLSAADALQGTAGTRIAATG